MKSTMYKLLINAVLCGIFLLFPVVSFAQIPDPHVENPMPMDDPAMKEGNFEETMMFIEDFIRNLPKEDSGIMLQVWENMPPEEKNDFVNELMNHPKEERIHFLEKKTEEIMTDYNETVPLIENFITSMPKEDRILIREMWDTMPPMDKRMFIQDVARAPLGEKEQVIQDRINEILRMANEMPNDEFQDPDMMNPENRLIDLERKNQPRELEKPDLKNAKTNMPYPEDDAEDGVWYKDWEAWGVILAILGALAALIGYIAQRKKSTITTSYFKDIDNAYSTFKMKGYRCEAELYRLRDIITDDFKAGNMDENAFQLLDNRIEKYMLEVRENIINEKFGGMPTHLKESLQQMLESGEITPDEYNKFHGLVDKSTLSAKDKTELDKIVKEWSDVDK